MTGIKRSSTLSPMTDNTQLTTSLRLTEEDKEQLAKAKKLIARKGFKVKTADALRAALYFFVEMKEAEKSVKPTQK